MTNTRLVYAKRGPENKWTLITFDDIAINEDFILCEPDGVPVGHYLATSQPYVNVNGIDEIRNIEVSS